MINMLTGNMRLVYHYIQENPNATQKDIFLFSGLHRRTVQDHLYSLESVNYIKVKRDKNFKRYSVDKRRKL